MRIAAGKSRFTTFAWFGGLLLVLLLAGCGGPEPKVSPKAQALAEKIKQGIKVFAPPLVEPASQNDVKKTSEVLSDLFMQAAKKGRPFSFALYVLDNQGRFLAGRYGSPGNPEGIKDIEGAGQDYSKTKVISSIIKNPKIMQSRLYIPQAKYYAIFVPLLKDGDLAGILAIAFAAPLLHDELGVSEKDFLALDFNR